MKFVFIYSIQILIVLHTCQENGLHLVQHFFIEKIELYFFIELEFNAAWRLPAKLDGYIYLLYKH